MANYSILKTAIADYVKDRTGLDTIDGDGLQETLLAMVNALGANYQYAGIAKLTPTQTNPGSPDANVFYIATEPGTYTNFVGAGGSLVVNDGEVAIFKFNGQWSKETTGAATAAQVTELGQEIVKRLFNKSIVGEDMTYVEVPTYGLIPNHTYYLFIKNTNWTLPADMPETGKTKLAIDSIYNGQKTNLRLFVKSSVVPQPISFTIPENSDYLLVGGRAAVGTNIEFYISDVNPQDIIDLVGLNIFDFTFTQGTINGGWLNPENTECISNPNYLSLENFKDGLMYLYNEKQQDGNYWKVRIGFYREDESFIIQNGYSFFEGLWTLAIPENAKYFRISISLCDENGAIGCTPSDIPTDGTRITIKWNLQQEIGDLQSGSAPLPLNRFLGYSMDLLFSVTSGYGDAACYNGLIFQFIDGNQYVYVHDASNGTLIQTITMPNPDSGYHNNSVSFGSEKYDVNDTYPLLYASQERSTQNKCIVYRITGSQGSYEMTVVQTITYPTNAQTSLNYHNCYIDTKNNYLLLGGLVNYPYSSMDGNTLQYLVFELPSLSDGNITLQMSDMLFKSGRFANMPTTQGGFCKNGYLYQVFGVGGAKLLMVYDIKNCKYCYVYDLAEVYDHEPEGAFDYNNAIHVVFNGGRVYKFGMLGLL